MENIGIGILLSLILILTQLSNYSCYHVCNERDCEDTDCQYMKAIEHENG